jgi:hypothetical protein
MTDTETIEGMVYRSVSGSPNLRCPPTGLDASEYFLFHQMLLRFVGSRVRITIERLEAPEHTEGEG